ncbi:MAG: hypothetical protein WAK95_18415 [Desulfobacterales bacterium]
MPLFDSAEANPASDPATAGLMTDFLQPNRFFTGLANGIVLALPAWAIVWALLVWMF